jgi:RimJ/RimL family protein N-acetyltransferase
MKLPEVLDTRRLQLRRWREDDVEQVLKAVKLSLSELRPWMPWAQKLATPEEQREVIRKTSIRFDAGEEFQYWLFEKATGELVGAGGLNLRPEDSAEVGYWVRSDRHRQGYATEAARAFTAAAFECFPSIQTVRIRMDKANIASAGIPPKLGFQLEGEEEFKERLAPAHSGRGLIWRMSRSEWSLSQRE